MPETKESWKLPKNIKLMRIESAKDLWRMSKMLNKTGKEIPRELTKDSKQILRPMVFQKPGKLSVIKSKLTWSGWRPT
jgi:hypothetical protein